MLKSHGKFLKRILEHGKKKKIQSNKEEHEALIQDRLNTST